MNEETNNTENNNNLIVINDNDITSINENSDNDFNDNEKNAWEDELHRCDKINIEESIKNYVVRIENLEAEIQEINTQKSDLFKEMKDKNICVEAIKEIVKERKKDPVIVEIVNLNKEQYKNYLI
jgi:uncharacterized protein (UPF0335 family)